MQMSIRASLKNAQKRKLSTCNLRTDSWEYWKHWKYWKPKELVSHIWERIFNKRSNAVRSTQLTRCQVFKVAPTWPQLVVAPFFLGSDDIQFSMREAGVLCKNAYCKLISGLITDIERGDRGERGRSLSAHKANVARTVCLIYSNWKRQCLGAALANDDVLPDLIAIHLMMIMLNDHQLTGRERDLRHGDQAKRKPKHSKLTYKKGQQQNEQNQKT